MGLPCKGAQSCCISFHKNVCHKQLEKIFDFNKRRSRRGDDPSERGSAQRPPHVVSRHSLPAPRASVRAERREMEVNVESRHREERETNGEKTGAHGSVVESRRVPRKVERISRRVVRQVVRILGLRPAWRTWNRIIICSLLSCLGLIASTGSFYLIKRPDFLGTRFHGHRVRQGK